MKFQLIVGLFNFLHTIHELQKHRGNTMKKCYSLLHFGPVLQDVLNRRLLFKTNRQQ